MLTFLKWPALSGIQLTGPIPLGLEHLTHAYNLIGPIPIGLGQLTNLWYLGLSENQLTGQSPPEMAQLQ